MSLMKYQPWSMFDQLHKEVNDLFDRRIEEQSDPFSLSQNQWHLAVDITETATAFTVKADIPGVNPDDIEVSTENGRLVIKGQRHQEMDENQDGVHRVERSYGSFFRSFSLPDNIDVDAISAKSVHGVLELTLPKTDSSTARKIEIG